MGSRKDATGAGAPPPRRLTLGFRHMTAAQEAQALSVWKDQAAGGEQSVVVLPSTEKYPKLAVYGDMNPEISLDLELRGNSQPGPTDGDVGGPAGPRSTARIRPSWSTRGATFVLDD